MTAIRSLHCLSKDICLAAEFEEEKEELEPMVMKPAICTNLRKTLQTIIFLTLFKLALIAIFICMTITSIMVLYTCDFSLA